MSVGRERDHSACAEDLAAYCLGALEPGEAAELERHLTRCGRCRAEVERLGPAVDALAQSLALDPPPELRARLMAQVRAEAAARAPAAEMADRRKPRTRLRERSRALRTGKLALHPLAGAAAVLLVVGAVIGIAIGTGGSAEEREGRTVVAGRAPGVVAEVVRDGDAGTLRLSNVRRLPDERVLQAWVQRAGAVKPVRAVFVPDRDGRASTTIEDLRGVERVMVTTEPPGGSDSPTSAPIVAVALPQ